MCYINLAVFSMLFFCQDSGLVVTWFYSIVCHLKFQLFIFLSFSGENSAGIKCEQQSGFSGDFNRELFIEV